MAFRELVTSSDNCGPSEAGPSNALTQLATQLLGSSNKGKELAHLEPAQHATDQSTALDGITSSATNQLLGHKPGSSSSHHVPNIVPTLQGLQALQHSSDHAQMIQQQHNALQPLEQIFHHFVQTGGHQQVFVPQGAQSGLGISVGDQCRIRDRTTILARQLYSAEGNEFADRQVGTLLGTLQIVPDALPVNTRNFSNEFRGAWESATQHATQQPTPLQDHALADRAVHQPSPHHATANAWASDFTGTQQHAPPGPNHEHAPPPNQWASDFVGPQPAHQQWAHQFNPHPHTTDTQAETWARDFAPAAAAQDTAQTTSTSGIDRAMANRPLSISQWGASLQESLSASHNPKIAKSQFMQFVAKMSRGELMMSNNKLTDAHGNEIKEYSNTADAWSAEFANPKAQPRSEEWARQFSGADAGAEQRSADWARDFTEDNQGVESLIRDFSNWGVNPGARGGQDWASAFEGVDWVGDFEAEVNSADNAWAREMMAKVVAGEAEAEGDTAAGSAVHEWVNQFHELNEALGEGNSFESYVFQANNPYLNHAEPFALGQELFRKGVLTEACLALEAEVLARPGNSEAWRLLGTVHAENEDDVAAIQAMHRALAVDPGNPNLLLALGVSHTNQLEVADAVKYLYQWLARHAEYGAIVAAHPPPLDTSQWVTHVQKLFETAVLRYNSDADLHTALGVVYHLMYRYPAAIEAFKEATKLRPQDYSLWNKIGATLANSGNSREALGAYEKALQLKPNYVRAWTNIGVSLFNLGEYREAAVKYATALKLSPKIESVWNLLEGCVANMQAGEVQGMVKNKDLEALCAALNVQ